MDRAIAAPKPAYYGSTVILNGMPMSAMRAAEMVTKARIREVHSLVLPPNACHHSYLLAALGTIDSRIIHLALSADAMDGDSFVRAFPIFLAFVLGRRCWIETLALKIVCNWTDSLYNEMRPLWSVLNPIVCYSDSGLDQLVKNITIDLQFIGAPDNSAMDAITKTLTSQVRRDFHGKSSTVSKFVFNRVEIRRPSTSSVVSATVQSPPLPDLERMQQRLADTSTNRTPLIVCDNDEKEEQLHDADVHLDDDQEDVCVRRRTHTRSNST